MLAAYALGAPAVDPHLVDPGGIGVPSDNQQPKRKRVDLAEPAGRTAKPKRLASTHVDVLVVEKHDDPGIAARLREREYPANSGRSQNDGEQYAHFTPRRRDEQQASAATRRPDGQIQSSASTAARQG